MFNINVCVVGKIMKFLIQYNMLEESRLQAIKDAVQHLPHEFVGMIPFSREITHNDGVV